MGNHIPTRVIIGILIFCMFLVSNICNTCLHITIIAMINPRNSTLYSTPTDINPTNYGHKLKWDTLSVAIVQSGFFWGFCASKFPGGMLARRYGSRKVIGISVFIAAITSCLFPIAAKIHPILATIVRAILGLANGTTAPATMNLAAKWIPKCERSIFANVFHGNEIAMTISLPIGGLIVEYYEWESIFYLSGLLCFIWLIFWLHFGYESPRIHPKISIEEKTYIENELAEPRKDITQEVKVKTVSSVPWKSIITSKPIWATTVYMIGSFWYMISMNIQLPKYFSRAHNLDIKTIGLITGLPNICKLLFGVISGYYLDYLLKMQKISVTTLRKIATITSKIIPAIILVIFALVIDLDYQISIFLIIILFALNGTCVSAGWANLSDIAPNYAGVITGIIHTAIIIPGVLSPILCSSILSLNPNNGWFWIFLIVASIELFTGIIFIIFGSGKVQPWNNSAELQNENNCVELKSLVKNKN